MEMISVSLFNYILKPVSECAFPINQNGKKSVSWFWLTDSYYYIESGNVKLFENSPESIAKYNLKSCFDDYYYIRQLEDLFNILPDVSNPMPEDLYEYFSSHDKRKKLNSLFENWIDSIKNFTQEQDDIYDSISDFFRYGHLDTGYLRVKSDCCFCHVNDNIIIHYDFEDFSDNCPVWTAKSGKFILSYQDFLYELESLLDRFFCDMEKQISNAVHDLKNEDFYDILVQKNKNEKSGIEYLFEEHENRKIFFYSVLDSLRNSNCKEINWEKIRKNINFLESFI